MDKHSQAHVIHSHGYFPFNSESSSDSARAQDLEIRFRDQKGAYKLRFNLNLEERARRGGGRRIP